MFDDSGKKPQDGCVYQVACGLRYAENCRMAETKDSGQCLELETWRSF